LSIWQKQDDTDKNHCVLYYGSEEKIAKDAIKEVLSIAMLQKD